MAKNTFKNPEIKQSAAGSKSVNKWFAKLWDNILAYFDMENIVAKIPRKTGIQALWLLFLVILYIAYNLKYVAVFRSIEAKKIELNEKKSVYISVKSSFGQNIKKSEIIEKVKPAGLEENTTAPQKIIINKP